MTISTPDAPGNDDLRIVLGRTAAGDAELQQPRAGLSLPQRKLLTLVDGRRSLAALAANEPALNAERLARDAAVLHRLGLAQAQSGGPSLPATLPQTLPQTLPTTWPTTPPMTLPVTSAATPPLAAATERQNTAAPRTLPPATASRGAAPAVPVSAAAPPRRSLALPVVGVVVLAGLAGAVYAVFGGSDTPAPSTRAPAQAAASATPAPVPATAPAPVPAPAPAPEPQPAPAVADAPVPVPAQPTPEPAAAAPTIAQAPPSVAVPTPQPRPAAAGAAAPRTVVAPAPGTAATKGGAPVVPPAPARAATPPPTVVSTTATAPAADSVQPASAPAAAVAAASSTAAPLAAAAAPAAAERPLQPLRRVEPEFPREAARQGIDQGTVLAQLRIGADGRVEAVTTSATGQSRVFERAARTALAEWSFPPGAPGRVYRVQLDFRR